MDEFDTYIRLGKVKRITPDSEIALSLFLKSKQRLLFLSSQSITAENAVFIFEEAYEACREIAQSLMAARGFKPYSHEASISFLSEFHKALFSCEDINKLDQLRRLRNDSVYKAEPIRVEDTKETIRFAKRMLSKVENLMPQ